MFCNPLVPLFVQTNKWFSDPGAAGAVQEAGGWVHLIPAAAIFVAVCIGSVRYFNRQAPLVAEDL